MVKTKTRGKVLAYFIAQFYAVACIAVDIEMPIMAISMAMIVFSFLYLFVIPLRQTVHNSAWHSDGGAMAHAWRHTYKIRAVRPGITMIMAD